MKLTKSTAPWAIVEEYGRRLKRLRLNQNLKQTDLATHSGLSRKVIMEAEKGKVTLENLVHIFYSLDALDHLDGFLPEPPLSPRELLKMRGKARQKASGEKKVKEEPKVLDW
ncbi:helix-turn-helix domain-containing protein [Acinetobacter lwoffii]|uniref:helix-turn-helix domain-containing protein n=1 Tax=Acinetobacter lwoffii TaxID=28090 RepID=UPI00209B0EBC|nr:helix-turn-helix transcriptional regulator [Acinetobacter lwoffii]MCO8073031.1 helix-turn-helix domain-containing protein [Acinetobacter lwoffii]MCO8076155.1 helix-turn-helix domain-containing protein [Acinetobacter lwoffii]